jgi:hypothetical protein
VLVLFPRYGHVLVLFRRAVRFTIHNAMSSRTDPPALEDRTNAALANSTDPPPQKKRAKRTTHARWETRKTPDGECSQPPIQTMRDQEPELRGAHMRSSDLVRFAQLSANRQRGDQTPLPIG